MGKSTIPMVIFHCYVSHYQRVTNSELLTLTMLDIYLTLTIVFHSFPYLYQPCHQFGAPNLPQKPVPSLGTEAAEEDLRDLLGGHPGTMRCPMEKSGPVKIFLFWGKDG
jgi:hypothetical protein